MDVRVGLWRKLSTEELMLLNCGVGEAETLVLWPPHVKSWLIGKDSDAIRDWAQEEKEMTEDEMAGWHHWLDGHESEWTLGVGDGQGGLACWDSWGCKESDTTEWLNWTELNEPIRSIWKDRLSKVYEHPIKSQGQTAFFFVLASFVCQSQFYYQVLERGSSSSPFCW